MRKKKEDGGWKSNRFSTPVVRGDDDDDDTDDTDDTDTDTDIFVMVTIYSTTNNH